MTAQNVIYFKDFNGDTPLGDKECVAMKHFYLKYGKVEQCRQFKLKSYFSTCR